MDKLRDLVVNRHIQEHRPNAQLETWDSPNCHLEFYTARELQDVSGDWFPLCCHLDPDTGMLRYGGRSRISHTYTEGETGAGKTSRFAMQSIRALSCKADRPSFLVVDIHGELAENLYPHLTENGYTIRILNCDDPDHSDTYNPFATMVERCLETGTMDHEVISQIRKIAQIIQPVISRNDPIWEQGAQSYTNGAILDKFEDLLAGNIPPECITLYNIIQNHYWLRKETSSYSHSGNILSIKHYSKKGTRALSIQKMMSVTNNAEKTRASYFGVVENHYDAFGQTSLYKLSSSSTIDIREMVEKPTAIFIQSGSTNIGDHLISLMVNEIYNIAVRMGRESATKMLPRRIHCFLDEFANSNIADGPEFVRMLTTSRKFGMYWHILLQCDAQLDRKFDPNIARIVRANCTELFMGSNDHDTMVRFAKSCGTRTVESLGSQVSGQAPQLETVELITADRLNLLPEGHVYIKSNRRPLLLSYIEAFYRCPEFQPVADIRSVYPVNDFDFTSTAFYPDDIPPQLSLEEFQLLQYLYRHGPMAPQDIRDQFPQLRTSVLLGELLKLELLTKDTEKNTISCAVSESFFRLIAAQHPNVPELVPESESAPEGQSPGKSQGQTLEKLSSHIADAIAQRVSESKPTEFQLTQLFAHFTCIPKNVVNAFHYFAGFAPDAREDAMSLDSPTLHYEFLEEFIRNRDLPSKEDWVDFLRHEYEYAITIPIFPRELIVVFAKTLREMKNNLTLEQIRQIKDILK